MNKRLIQYIAFWGYSDKLQVILSAISGIISIASFAAVIGTPVIGIVSAGLSLAFHCLQDLYKIY